MLSKSGRLLGESTIHESGPTGCLNSAGPDGCPVSFCLKLTSDPSSYGLGEFNVTHREIEFNMIKTTLCLLASALALQVAAAPTGTSAPARSLPAPSIESIVVNAGLITVTGVFSSVGTQLTLGKHRLEVSDSTPTQVVAKLPQGLRPATYLLQVNNLNSSGNLTSMFLQIP